MDIDQEKIAAARRSLAFVRSGDVVGLGTGSTASYFIRFLAERVRAGLDIRAIPTSNQSEELARSLGIPLTSFEESAEVDVTIDGADEIGPNCELLKGGGGALLREKVVASASRKVVIIADSTKQVQSFGGFPLPVEVVCFAQPLLARRIGRMGAAVGLRRGGSGSPFLTDEGHHILDCRFGGIPNPAKLADELIRMPGLVEHGLFINLADVILIGKGSSVLELYPGREAHR